MVGKMSDNETEWCEICKKNTISYTKGDKEYPVFCNGCKQPRA